MTSDAAANRQVKNHAEPVGRQHGPIGLRGLVLCKLPDTSTAQECRRDDASQLEVLTREANFRAPRRLTRGGSRSLACSDRHPQSLTELVVDVPESCSDLETAVALAKQLDDRIFDYSSVWEPGSCYPAGVTG